MGSIDIDLVVDPDIVGENEYATIVHLLGERGWTQSPTSRFTFLRASRQPGPQRESEIAVDFLTSAPARAAGKHRHRQIQGDLQARTMEGAPLALLHRQRQRLTGSLPDGGEASADIHMADSMACVGMKGLALGSRYKEKDAYDLYAVLRYGPDDPRALGARVRAHATEPLMTKACAMIKEKFAKPASAGPMWVGQFMAPGNREEQTAIAEQAFIVVDRFLNETGTPR